MENTLRKFRAPLFADWGSDVSAALAYVAQLSSASAEGPAINTAAHVLLNTVINAVDKMLATTSPEKLAIIELINDQIRGWANTWAENELGQKMDNMLDDKIGDWMDDNLSDKMGEMIDDSIGDKIGDWMDDNLTDRLSGLTMEIVCK